MSTTSDAIGSMVFKGGNPEMELCKPFHVRLLTPVPGVYEEEIVWAHLYQVVDGAVQFIVYKMKDSIVTGADGKPETTKILIATYPHCIALGQWRAVNEGHVPDHASHQTH